MKLSDILKKQGLFSSDIKTRIKNKQITLNGEVVTSDVELFVEDELINAGNFIFSLAKNQIFLEQMKMFGFENLFDSNIDSELTRILNQHMVLKISKKEIFILKKLNYDNKN